MHIAPELRKLFIMKFKAKLTVLTLVLLFVTAVAFSQKDDDAQYIISGNVGIDKYHDREDLESMPKGELLSLYNTRIEIIIKILPNIAFATKPGVTMNSLGIPDTKENIEATTTYFDNTVEFQKIVLPYSDRANLISAILFYEETLKALHTYNDFN